MLASLKSAADFSRGCAHPAMQALISATHPYPVIRKNRSPIALSGVYLCLIDPLAQSLGRNVQIAGNLHHWIALLGGVNQPDGFLLKFRRVELASLAHFRPLSRNLIA
jgi:hypothetical protein